MISISLADHQIKPEGQREAKDLENAIEAMRLGLAARDFETKTGVAFRNPFEDCSTDRNAFNAGLENDLMAWLEIRSEILGVGFGE